MKYTSIFALIVFLPVSVFAQTVSVTTVGSHANLTQSEFSLYRGEISVSPNQLTVGAEAIYRPVSWSVSSYGMKVGTIEPVENLNLLQYDYRGSKLFEKELEFFNPNDETIAIYQFDSGKVITRDNVANFTFFAPDGRTLFSVSNSSQSSGGERVSELAADPTGKTVVLYNPVIAYGNSRGSRASLVFGDQDTREFFRSDNEQIKYLNISADGAFLSILTTGLGNDTAYIYDRFGNKIFELALDEGQLGLTLSNGGQYLTSFSRGRIQVYNIFTGERIGSTSSRNPVLYAKYIQEDEIILALGGNYENRFISNPMFTAVHVSKRQIARQDVTTSLSAINLDKIDVERVSPGRFIMKGLNRDLEITARF